jgi:nucleotide-binding universal stress UspA family protein
MDFKRILVALNSPNGRDAAFERALALARSSGAELYLLHAVPANQPFSFRAPERLKRQADMRKRAEDAGVRMQAVEQHGDPAELIELHANARAVDLIVMGAEPRRGWRRRHRSLVAERVIRRTRVPTLVVAGDVSDSTAPFRNVVAAVDLSPASKDVLSGAIGLTAAEAGRLTVMHTVTGLEAENAYRSRARWMVPEYRAHVLDHARRTLESVVTAVPAAVATRLQVSTGSAARAIVEHAAAVDADLVVVGHRRGIKVLGSTVLRVLRSNERTLLVIPSPPQRTAGVEGGRAA